MTEQARAARPPRDLITAMAQARSGDDLGALETVEAALPAAQDRAPFLALASLSALRAQEPGRAIPHLRELIALHPGDMPSRLNLANALVETGDIEGALALANATPGSAMARVEGYCRQAQGRYAEAAHAYRKAVETDPGDLASWNNLANACAADGQYDAATAALEQAITLAPRMIELYLNLADILRRADHAGPRLKVMRDAHGVAPHDRRVLTELAMAQIHADDLEGAIATLEETVERYPEFSEAHIELGRLYEAFNRVDDMAELIERTDLANAPPEAAFLLAWQAQREGRFDDAAALAAKIPETIHPGRRFHLIGQIAERRGDSATAFAAFERMNAHTVAEAAPAVGPSFRQQIESDMRSWTAQFADDWQTIAPADDLRDPIFLVGFPRSGTTLLDTMLMGLPGLCVLEERPMVAQIAARIGKSNLTEMSAERVRELRRAYFESARAHGLDDSRWLVDKHPLNMVRVPLIARLFPQARFIIAERHPYDAVLSCFMANFQPNFAMRSFTDLEEAARTYDAAFAAWSLATTLVPVAAHSVRYERLVEDPRGELEPVVAWLGLEWNDALLAHAETAGKRGRVRTASYSQIGEQLYGRASGRWKRYREQLKPVEPILRPWAERMGYPVD